MAVAALWLAPAAHADTILWISDGTDNIGQVDITTQQVVSGSVHNTGLALTDIAFDAGGQMYGTTLTALAIINKNTGASGIVSSYVSESGMNALVGTGTNSQLLGASFQNTNIYRINDSNAALTVISTAPSTSAGDLAFAGNVLYGIGQSGGPNTLETLTGTIGQQVLHVGSAGGPTLSNVFGLADDGTTMYAVAGTEVYSVNLATAVLTPLFDYSLAENGQNLTSVTGAAFIGEGPAGVPEPATFGLLGVGLLGLGFFAQRKHRQGKFEEKRRQSCAPRDPSLIGWTEPP